MKAFLSKMSLAILFVASLAGCASMTSAASDPGINDDGVIRSQ